MRIRWDTGEEARASIAEQARILRNMQAEVLKLLRMRTPAREPETRQDVEPFGLRKRETANEDS